MSNSSGRFFQILCTSQKVQTLKYFQIRFFVTFVILKITSSELGLFCCNLAPSRGQNFFLKRGATPIVAHCLEWAKCVQKCVQILLFENKIKLWSTSILSVPLLAIYINLNQLFEPFGYFSAHCVLCGPTHRELRNPSGDSN